MLIPVLVLIFGVFFGGLVMGLMQSFGCFPAIGMMSFTLDYYWQVLSGPDFLPSLGFSLYVSFVSSILSLALGVLLAYLLMRNGAKKHIDELLYKLPVIVPHAVSALLIYTMFSQSGLISRVLYHFGMIESTTQMAHFLYDRTGRGVILAYMWKEIPFIAMVVVGVLRSVCGKLEVVSKNLGASEWQTFRYVIMPLIAPTLLSNFIIIFAFSFGAFEVPYLLGPTSPRALPVLSYIEYTNPDLTHRPYTMAINMLITLVVLSFVGGSSYVFKKISRYRI